MIAAAAYPVTSHVLRLHEEDSESEFFPVKKVKGRWINLTTKGTE